MQKTHCSHGLSSIANKIKSASNIKKMEKLISNKLNISSVPESYILPLEERPGTSILPPSGTIPVIDLSENCEDRTNIVHEIIQVGQEFGFFLVINHGVAENVINDMMDVAEEFFQMHAEDRAVLYSEDPKQIVRVSTSISYDKETHYWRVSLKHPCYPLEKFRDLWPSKPTKYRDIAGSYVIEVRKLALKLMELIGEGLGIKATYFEDELCNDQSMLINHYPRCPDPSLTMGLPKHCGPNILTILLQGDVAGLHVKKNGEWVVVERR